MVKETETQILHDIPTMQESNALALGPGPTLSDPTATCAFFSFRPMQSVNRKSTSFEFDFYSALKLTCFEWIEISKDNLAWARQSKRIFYYLE